MRILKVYILYTLAKFAWFTIRTAGMELYVFLQSFQRQCHFVYTRCCCCYRILSCVYRYTYVIILISNVISALKHHFLYLFCYLTCILCKKTRIIVASSKINIIGSIRLMDPMSKLKKNWGHEVSFLK